MKIRTGHVSNSSTASFICATKLSVAEVFEYMLELYKQTGCSFKDGADFSVHEYTKKEEKEYYDNGWNEYYKIPSSKTHHIEVVGTGDNSIPWEVMDCLYCNAKLRSTHIHLG